MPELSTDAVHALIRALMPDMVPSALEDVSRRFMQDQPIDVTNYIATMRTQLPHAFAPALSEPAAPAAGTPDHDARFLANLETLAGQPPAAAASTSTSTPPASVAKDDGRAFVANLERIASGECQVV